MKPVNKGNFRFSGVDWGLDMDKLTGIGWDESKGNYLEHKKKVEAGKKRELEEEDRPSKKRRKGGSNKR